MADRRLVPDIRRDREHILRPFRSDSRECAPGPAGNGDPPSRARQRQCDVAAYPAAASRDYRYSAHWNRPRLKNQLCYEACPPDLHRLPPRPAMRHEGECNADERQETTPAPWIFRAFNPHTSPLAIESAIAATSLVSVVVNTMVVKLIV